MAAIAKTATGKFIAVHRITGKRLLHQPKTGFNTPAKARVFAAKVCKQVMGKSCPTIPFYKPPSLRGRRSMAFPRMRM